MPAEAGRQERAAALADLERQQARLDAIADPLLTRSAPLCPIAAAPRVGLRVATVYEYDEPWRDAAADGLGLNDTLAVLGRAREGAAGRAGLEPGDRMLAVNGRAVPVGPAAAGAFADAVREAGQSGGELRLDFRRGAERRSATVSMVPGCDYGTLVLAGDELDAYADGRSILLTSALLRQTGDDGLRVLLAHQLAHLARSHVGTRRRRGHGTTSAFGLSTGGRVASDSLRAAARAFGPDVEREIDELALQALALAGYPLDAAPRFWREVVQADPDAAGIAATHPVPAERLAAMEQAIAAIERRRAGGEPLAAAARPRRPSAGDTAASPAVPASRVRSPAELQLDAGLRQTLGDVLRLRIAEAYEEADPGLLVVVLTPEAFTRSSTEYNLKQLWLAYDRATLWPESVTLELWQEGGVIGRYTREGLLLESDPAATLPAQ